MGEREDWWLVQKGTRQEKEERGDADVGQGLPLTTLGLQVLRRQAWSSCRNHLNCLITTDTVRHCKYITAKFLSSSHGPSGSSKAAAPVRRRRGSRREGGEERREEGGGDLSNPGCGQYARRDGGREGGREDRTGGEEQVEGPRQPVLAGIGPLAALLPSTSAAAASSMGQHAAEAEAPLAVAASALATAPMGANRGQRGRSQCYEGGRCSGQAEERDGSGDGAPGRGKEMAMGAKGGRRRCGGKIVF